MVIDDTKVKVRLQWVVGICTTILIPVTVWAVSAVVRAEAKNREQDDRLDRQNAIITEQRAILINLTNKSGENSGKLDAILVLMKAK